MYEKPLPVIDGESRPYWDALKQHRLTLKDGLHESRLTVLAGCPSWNQVDLLRFAPV